MIFEWDEAKRLINLEKHGVDFVDAPKMWAGPMLVAEDTRREYGEPRYVGMGHIEGRLMVIVHTHRSPNIVRVISLRKANSREVHAYESSTNR
ncbi:BrnT family toxin [Acidithiobacillus thiooxidans]|uniref:BrnT family toxin n=1 Tax=Acidithiobacillus thiooxidans TaxID=930 RepID=UPI000983854B|nr:BrnT family toxin [Acidithiobacillus thiooxidans]